MALFQAAGLICRYSMTSERAKQSRELLTKWIDGLHSIHPHTVKHKKRPNVHASLHLEEFLLLFGPVTSWWCFPFERLIGQIQKINTNDFIGALTSDDGSNDPTAPK
ncbi:hypothetical protein H0H93_004167 [Arthromyces matolae]|nr:hypothetical protein H0H93_004167 [Arthromyces matolae]